MVAAFLECYSIENTLYIVHGAIKEEQALLIGVKLIR